MKCFVNGDVHTLHAAHPRAEAVVTRGSRIVYVGSSQDARSFAGPGAEVMDMHGQLMLPGFIDDHVHFVLGGSQVAGLHLRQCTSTAGIVETVAAYVSTHRGAWICGGDWDEEGWDVKRLPVRALIDPVSPDTPVFINRFDWHMALANSVALGKAGITRETPDPPGGTIVRDPATGEPTGMLKDAAMDLVTRVMPRSTPGELEHAVLQALDVARSNGDLGS